MAFGGSNLFDKIKTNGKFEAAVLARVNVACQLQKHLQVLQLACCTLMSGLPTFFGAMSFSGCSCVILACRRTSKSVVQSPESTSPRFRTYVTQPRRRPGL